MNAASENVRGGIFVGKNLPMPGCYNDTRRRDYERAAEILTGRIR